nr:putative ribonuclease H-like domain-containing protein [Tanacetum cinerariifolium]
MAFISSSKHSSGDEDGNTACVSTASTTFPTARASVATISQDTASAYIASQSSGSRIKFEDINQIDEDDMEEMDIKWSMALLSMRADKFWKRTGKKINIQGSDVGSKADEKTPKALMAIDGVGWDWSYTANEGEDHALVADAEAPTEFVLMANTESKRSDKVKHRVGYNDVHPPATDLYLSPKKDLSWTGLPKFVDDTVTDYSRPSPTVASTSAEGQNKNSTTSEDVASPNTPKPFVKKRVQRETTRSQNHVYMSPTHRSVGHKPHGAPIRPPHRSIGHKPHGAPMRPPHRSAGHRPHGPSMNPMRPNMNVKTQYRAPCVPTVNRNNLPVNRKFFTGRINFLTANRKFPTASRKFPTASIKIHTADMGRKGKAVHDALLESSSSKPQDGCNPEVPEGSGNTNPTAFTSNPPTEQMETLIVEIPISTVSSPILTACLNDSLEPSSDARLISKRVANQEETPSMDNILSLTNMFEDILGVTTSSDEAIRMEAKVSNMETTISASPTPTLRIHKDHLKSQIIGHVDTPIQTRHKSKEKEDGIFLSHDKYIGDILKKFGYSDVRSSNTHMDKENPWGKDGTGKDGHPKIGLWYPKESPFDLVAYSDSDYDGASKDRKSTTEGKTTSSGTANSETTSFGAASSGAASSGAASYGAASYEAASYGAANSEVTSPMLKIDLGLGSTTSTPMETHNPLLKDEDGEEVNVHMYRSMIGSLMYLTSSRPNIMFAVCACVRYHVNLKVSHLHAVKRIFRYLKGHLKLGFWYLKDSPFDLVAYTDNGYAGASLDRKSTTRGCLYLRCRLISWQCKKQIMVSKSIIEAEYVAASSCCGKVL